MIEQTRPPIVPDTHVGSIRSGMGLAQLLGVQTKRTRPKWVRDCRRCLSTLALQLPNQGQDRPSLAPRLGESWVGSTKFGLGSAKLRPLWTTFGANSTGSGPMLSKFGVACAKLEIFRPNGARTPSKPGFRQKVHSRSQRRPSNVGVQIEKVVCRGA